MGSVVAAATMSLDGYIAKHDNTIGGLFDWLQAGEVTTATATPDITLHLTPESAAYWHERTSQLGALVCGRTLFDFTDGWGGRHTMDVRLWSSRTNRQRTGSPLTPTRRSHSSRKASRKP